MQITSILAIFFLFWVLSALLALPFGVRTAEEAGVEHVPGQAESAPHGYDWGRTAIRATLLAIVLFGLFYLNYVTGFVTVDMLDYTRW